MEQVTYKIELFNNYTNFTVVYHNVLSYLCTTSSFISKQMSP